MPDMQQALLGRLCKNGYCHSPESTSIQQFDHPILISVNTPTDTDHQAPQLDSGGYCITPAHLAISNVCRSGPGKSDEVNLCDHARGIIYSTYIDIQFIITFTREQMLCGKPERRAVPV